MSTSLRVTWSTWASQSAPTSNYFRKTGYLSVSNQSSHVKFAYLWFSNPFPRTGANVLSAKLTLRTRKVTGSGTLNLGVDLATPYPVGIGLMNWNTRASAAGHKVQLTKSAPLAENSVWTFDVTDMMQTVGSGYGFNGFIVSTTNTRDINIQGNMSAALDPVLEVEWTEAPLAPDQLAPSTGQACGVALPVLRWSFWDHAGATGLGAAKVQVASAEDGFSSPLWDSGSLPLTETQLDLSATSCPAPAADTLRWWRVRNQDSAGLWSAWSDPVSWLWHARPTVSLVQPEPEPVDVAGPELLANGGAEDGMTGWSGGEWYSAATDHHSGSHFFTGAPDGGAMSQTVAVSAGRHTLSAWVGHPSTVTAQVTVTPNVGSPVTVPLTASSDWGVWAQTTAEVTIPDGATSAVVSVSSSGDWCRIDDLSLAPILSDLPVFHDPTPVIAWQTSGDMPQARWRASVSVLEGSAWRVVASSGTVVSAETSWTPDVGLADAGTVRIIVDVWDDRQREATPGTPIYASASGEFTFQPSDTVEIPRGIELDADGILPVAALRFTRSEVPDRWDIYRDGRLVTRHPGLDFLVEGNQYEVPDLLCPAGPHDWTVFAIVNGVACKSQMIRRSVDLPGTWIVDQATGDRVWIQGESKHDMTMPETTSTFTPIGARSSVVITVTQLGYEGTLTGTLVDQPWLPDSETAALWRRRLLAWKATPGRPLWMVTDGLCFPAAISEVSVQSTHPWVGERWDVTLKFHQTGDFEFGVQS